MKHLKFMFIIAAIALFSLAYSWCTILDSSKFIKHFVDMLVFCIGMSAIPFLNKYITFLIFKYKYIFKYCKNYFTLCFIIKTEIIYTLGLFSILNFFHIRSWSTLFITSILFLICTLLIFYILFLKNINIRISNIKKAFNVILKKISYHQNHTPFLIEKNFWIGLGGVLFSLIFIEIINGGTYFVNDDNFTQFNPVILDACKNFFEKGIFPEINPYQFAGLPTSSAGVYSLTNPFIYISYFFAKYIGMNAEYTLDVFAIINLMLAYIFIYIATRLVGINKNIAILVCICYCLSGYSLIGVRSWYYMAPITAFAPFIIIGLELIKRQQLNVKYFIIGTIITALLGYGGNFQMFVYGCSFYILGIILLLITQKTDIKGAIKAIFPIIFGFILTIPQIYVTLDLFNDIERIPWNFNRSTFFDFKTFIIPNYMFEFFGLKDTNFHKYFGQVFYSGSTFFIVSMMAIILLIVYLAFFAEKNKIKTIRLVFANNIYLALGLFALIMSFGNEFYLWKIIHSLPIFNKFIQPIKMMVFVNLFLNISGALLLSKILLSKKIEHIICILTLILMFLHINSVDSAFYYFENNKYKDISDITTQIPDIRNHRVYSYSPRRSDKEYYSYTLNSNFPTFYKIPSIDAYNDRLEILLKDNMHLYKKMYDNDASLVFQSNLVDKYLYEDFLEYGVKYFIYMDFDTNEEWYKLTKADEYANNKIKKFINKNFKCIYKYKDINYYIFKDAKPLVFNQDIKEVPFELNTQGIKVFPGNNDTTITINFLNRRHYRLFADKKPLDYTTDAYNRIVVKILPNTKELVLTYHSPWEKGALLMLIMLVIFIPITYIFYKKVGYDE